VYVYTVSSSGWTTTTRKTAVKVTAGTHMSQSYANDTLTLNCDWPTVDQTYDASSANAQSGVAVASAIAGVNAVPASTSADADKVLTVNSQGTPAWASAQAPISAGNGIDITNNVVSVDTSVVATQTDLAGKEDAFDVGTGLEMDTSGSTPTLQVEAPVDIVGGPGIVIDNPDGNTLRVSQAYPTDETVLYESSTGALDSIPLSESLSNFERVKITWKDWSSFDCINIQEFDTKSSNFMLTCTWAGASSSIIIFSIAMSPNAAKTALTNLFARFINFSNTSSVSTASNTRILKVIGCHRIAGGN